VYVCTRSSPTVTVILYRFGVAGLHTCGVGDTAKENSLLAVPFAVKSVLELSAGSRIAIDTEEEELVEVVTVVLTEPSAAARSVMSVMYSALGTASSETVCQMPVHGYDVSFSSESLLERRSMLTV
jgi:hypothetical protein